MKTIRYEVQHSQFGGINIGHIDIDERIIPRQGDRIHLVTNKQSYAREVKYLGFRDSTPSSPVIVVI